MSRFLLDARTARATWTILVILGIIGLAYVVRAVLLLLVLSLFFAYLLFPAVHLAQRWIIRRRSLAIAIVYLVVLAILVGAGAAVGPRLSDEVRALAQRLPEMTTQIQSGQIVERMLQRRGWGLGEIEELERLARAHMGLALGYFQQGTAALLKWLAGAWVVVLIPILAFFILKDADRLAAATISALSQRSQRSIGWAIARDLHDVLAQYVRALLLLALITFVVWTLAFVGAGVPYALVLAAIGGALEFIPVIGPLTAGILTVGVCLFSGYAHPWLVAAFIVVWRGIQDYVSAPFIMGRGIEIHPALIIVGVLAGGEIAGVAGMFLSVPVIAAVRIISRRLQESEPPAPDVRKRDGPVAAPRHL